MTVSRAREPGVAGHGAEPAAVGAVARGRDQRDRPSRRGELALALEVRERVPLPGAVGDLVAAVLRGRDPPAGGAVVGEGGPHAGGAVAHGQPGARQHHEVVGRVGGDQHRDPAGRGAPGRARVVEGPDLLVRQALPGGALGAVLRHAVAVPVAVALDRDPRVRGHRPGVRGRRARPGGQRCGEHRGEGERAGDQPRPCAGGALGQRSHGDSGEGCGGSGGCEQGIGPRPPPAPQFVPSNYRSGIRAGPGRRGAATGTATAWSIRSWAMATLRSATKSVTKSAMLEGDTSAGVTAADGVGLRGRRGSDESGARQGDRCDADQAGALELARGVHGAGPFWVVGPPPSGRRQGG